MSKRPSVTIPSSSSSPQLLDTPTPTKLLEAVDEAGVFQDLAESPFDRDFRQATKKRRNEEEEFLNTPQIFPPTPLEKSSKTLPTAKKASPYKAIAPKESSAQLILKLPTGPSFFLSNLPFAVKDPQPERPAKPQATKEEDLRERNRYAAIRSRGRRKKKIDEELARAKKLEEANQRLLVENEELKKRILALESSSKSDSICKICSTKNKDIDR